VVLLFAGRKKQPGLFGRRLTLHPTVVAALLLALLSLFFLLQVVPHTHADGHDDPACRLCQVAHIGVAPVVQALLLSLVVLAFGSVAAPIQLHTLETFFGHSPSRAPPAPIA
jgi:hypothetical protein